MFQIEIDAPSKCPQCPAGLEFASSIIWEIEKNEDETQYRPKATIQFTCTHCDIKEYDVQTGDWSGLDMALRQLELAMRDIEDA